MLLKGRKHSPKEIKSVVGVLIAAGYHFMQKNLPADTIHWPSQSPDNCLISFRFD